MSFWPGAPLFGRFFQIAYVTTDIERAAETFRDRYGVHRFLMRESDHTLMTPRGPERTQYRAALAYVGDTMLEIIEPTGGDCRLYDEFLPGTGFAIAQHHLGFRIDAWQAFRGSVDEAGRPIAAERSNPMTKWVYLDERELASHYLEYVFMDRPLLALFESIPRNPP